MMICIDAGCGPEEIFGSHGDCREEREMFLLQKYLAAALKRYGFQVVCTRQTAEHRPTREERFALGRQSHMVLGLYTGCLGPRPCPTVDQVQVFYPRTGKGRDLAREMSEVVAAVMGTAQLPRISKADGAAVSLLDCAPLGLMIRHSFRSHPAMSAWLREKENLQTLAGAEAALVADYFGLEAPEMRFELLKDVKSQLYRPTLERLLAKGLLPTRGGRGEDTVLDLGEDALRLLVLLEEAGVFQRPAAPSEDGK